MTTVKTEAMEEEMGVVTAEVTGVVTKVMTEEILPAFFFIVSVEWCCVFSKKKMRRNDDVEHECNDTCKGYTTPG